MKIENIFLNVSKRSFKMNNRALKIALDLYERNFVTVNNLDHLTYTEEYVNGFIGDIPTFQNNYTVYKTQCVDYTNKLLILFDRIKGNFKLITPSFFNKNDTIRIYWKILNNVSFLKHFLEMQFKFRKVFEKKIQMFEKEIQHEIGKKYIPLENIGCLKSRITKSGHT